MNAYWLVACIFMVLVGTTCALLIKHGPPLRDNNEFEFTCFIAFVITFIGGLIWPVALLVGAMCFVVWFLYSRINKIIIKRKGKKDAS